MTLQECAISTPSHDTDCFGWTRQQAQLLRTGCLDPLDVSNLIDEIEDLGQSQIRELENRLGILLATTPTATRA
jgi:hypothetical protein